MGQVCCKSKKLKDNAGNLDVDDEISKVKVDPDTEELNRIRDALHNNLETFLLDYILMSVQFFENYERDNEMLREKCLEEIRLTKHGKKCFYADTLHELVATKVTYQPKHGAKKNLEELLHPIRIYLTYENVEASYEENDNAIRPKEKPYYKLIVEDCIDNKKKNAGYVNLVESESYEEERPSVTEGVSRNNSFNLQIYNHTPGVQTPRKRSSKFSFRKSKPKFLTDTERRLSMTLNSSPRMSSFFRLSMVHSSRKDQIRKVLADQVIAQYDSYWCTTYEKVTKPRSVDDYRINNVPQTSTSIPKFCFQKIEQPLYKDKRRLGMTTGRPLEAIVSHNVLNSSAFKGHFCDVFVERIAENLEFDSKELNDAKVQGASIMWKKNKTTYQITPIIELKSWPECGSEFMRPVDKDPSQLPWPTIYLQKCVKNQGLSLTPVGYLEFREENTDYEKEWKIECPKGEKYLQLHLLHAQIRCYLFSLALYKAFIEVEEETLSFGPSHLLHLLFWEVKKNYLWPEAEPGFTFIRFLKVLYNKLQHRKLRDFFIHQRNLFGSSPAKDINRVLGRINLILENPVPYILLTIRNLKFKPNFYPKLNCSRLFKLVTEKDILTFLNPQLQIFRKSVLDITVTEEDEILEEDFEEDREKFVRAQLRKQIESERVANELMEQSRKSVDSIDVKAALVLDSKALRRQEILRCFIPHFIEMAVKSKEYHALDQCLMYLLHAKRLTQLLAEEQIDKSETYRYFERIDSIKLRCEKLKVKLTKDGEEDENENNKNEENKNEKKEEVKIEEMKNINEKAEEVKVEEMKNINEKAEEVKAEEKKVEEVEEMRNIVEKVEEVKVEEKEDIVEEKKETIEENLIEKKEESKVEDQNKTEENPTLANSAEINNSNIESKKIVETIMEEEEELDTKL